MSEAPKSNTGGAPSDRGIQQTPLDSNQRGQAQNIIDETKETFGRTSTDRDIGSTIGSGTSGRVDDILNKPGSQDTTKGAASKAASRTEEGMKVGGDADKHDLAASKQP